MTADALVAQQETGYPAVYRETYDEWRWLWRPFSALPAEDSKYKDFPGNVKAYKEKLANQDAGDTLASLRGVFEAAVT